MDPSSAARASGPEPQSGRWIGDQAAPRRINLQLENVLLGRNELEVGEQVFLSAAVSRNAFIHCYLANARGQIMRLLPNPVAPRVQLAAGQAIRLPDWMSPNPGYVIETAGPGTESLLCLATDEDVMSRLDATLQGPALSPLAGISNLDDVEARYTAVLPAAQLSTNRLSWQVRSRRAPATEAPAAPAGSRP